MYLSQAYNNEVIPTFLQDEEEAEGDKDAMKRMFIETEVCFLDHLHLTPRYEVYFAPLCRTVLR